MAPIKDSLIDLERHRILLQDNIIELRKALQHWQTWDAEYEGLKEEVTAAGPSPDDLERIQTDFDGELVKQKEIGEIFGLTGQKSKDQILNVLERRIDYVTKNIETLQKQLQAAENKYAAASIISQPDARDEEGQPITEILEELDEDDNVISFKLNRPGEGVPHIEEALKKAGIKDLVKDLAQAKKDVKEDTGRASTQAQVSQQESPSKIQAKEKHAAESKRKDELAPKKKVKKKVSFAETHDDVEEDEPTVSRMAARVENIMDAAKGQDAILKEKPVIPAGESPEDAALREEMLRYSMGEIGAVVAELEIEENQTSDYEEEDYEFEYSDADLDDDEDDDDEDKYGRFTGSIVTDDYRQRMLELEQKLGVKSRFTAKMEAEEAQEARVQEVQDESSDDEGIGRIVVTRGEDAPSSIQPSTDQTEGKPKKKGVRFAEDLDIAPEKPPKTTDAAPTLEKEAIVEPLSDIVERSGSSKPTEASSNRKPSRFKKTKSSISEAEALPKGPLDASPVFLDQDRATAPTGPEGKTIADQLVERETTPGVVPADDDLTDITLHQEIAAEHHRLRRKFIQREGGFLEEKESPTQPVDETEGGVGKRPSRFKAARLSQQ
ncbi:unnamed protein product [Clonostachys solani]|uniref:DUF3835 domain-containing protein n=1 Tax=Clonostachys solani TaxID=160281 RepID=A0A9N9ZJD1_9HYPO|nr:unnamed protein product [Clonostachys solani]